MTYYDNIFFHVQRLDGQRTEWKTGDVVSIKKENHNEFYSGLLRDAEFLEYLNGENVGLIEYSEQFFKSDINRNIQINDSNFKALYHVFEDNSFRYEELAKKLKS